MTLALISKACIQISIKTTEAHTHNTHVDKPLQWNFNKVYQIMAKKRAELCICVCVCVCMFSQIQIKSTATRNPQSWRLITSSSSSSRFAAQTPTPPSTAATLPSCSPNNSEPNPNPQSLGQLTAAWPAQCDSHNYVQKFCQ